MILRSMSMILYKQHAVCRGKSSATRGPMLNDLFSPQDTQFVSTQILTFCHELLELTENLRLVMQ